jgi:hypothetical protein
VTEERLIEKLRKIKAMAEGAKAIGSMQEAEAFAAMLQQLMLRHKIDMTDVEFAETEKDEPIGKHVVDWQEMKYGNRRIGWIEQLAHVVSRAYFCRFLVCTGSSRITLVGRKTDTEVAEFMLVTLVRSAERLVRQEYQRYRKENPGADTKGFQVSFMHAFAQRLRQRFAEERAKAAPTNSMALVRVDKADNAVVQYMNDNYRRKANGIGESTRGNVAGAQRGRAMADAMNLQANAIKPGEAPKYKIRLMR